MPVLGIDVLADSRVETVSIDDVCAATVAAARGEVAHGTVADLTELGSHRFTDLVAAVRGWLGFPPWRWRMRAPVALVSVTAKVADALGGLGWRSPLRTTALTVLRDGIHGDPRPWIAAGGAPCRSLADTLKTMPATSQDRWFARLYLLLPLIVGVLALFWLASGALGFIQFESARAVLMERGMGADLAAILVGGGAVIDIALGAGILIRSYARLAALGMAAVSLAYLAGGTLLTPDLWADPLGPLLKIAPALTLALVAAALLDQR